MQMEDVEKIRNSWGNKPCDHQNLEEEYYLGAATGDYICKQCGKSDYGSDWNKGENRKKKNK